MLCENPFADCRKWTDIVQFVNTVTGRGFFLRAVKERIERLLSLFKKSDKEKLEK